MTQPTFLNLHPNEYSQEIHYYPFAVKSDRCVGSCNTLNELSNKVAVSNKIEDLDISVFNMITKINQLETVTKHISCECKCWFDGRKCNSVHWWNNDKFWFEYKKHICEIDYLWNPATCSCKIGKYLASITDDSIITCDEDAEEETKTITTNFNKKMQCLKQKNYILLPFLLITVALLIAVSI